MRKKRLKKGVLIVLTIGFLVIYLLSLSKVFHWNKENEHTEELDNKILDKVEIIEKEDNDNTEVIVPEEKPKKTNPYWDYIKVNLMDVDLKELKLINSDTVGWVKMNNTNINYPFVQTDNNEYYLKHSFDKSKNSAGWVFLDYRNNIKDLGKNTIIYAHSRGNGTMFGSLKQTLKENWFDKGNHYIQVSTESSNTLWQIFSIYHILTTNDYIQVDFNNNEEFLKFANKLKERSIYNFDTNIEENDKIITLSTCYHEDEKLVVHAKLIKQESK